MRLPLLAAALLFPVQIFAAGSFSPEEDLAPILEEAPVLREFVEGALELAPGGSASRIGNAVNPRLGGRRVGPYHILARPKGTEGSFTFELIFHTEIVYLDERGEAVGLPEAVAIRERFESLEIRLVAPE